MKGREGGETDLDRMKTKVEYCDELCLNVYFGFESSSTMQIKRLNS